MSCGRNILELQINMHHFRGNATPTGFEILWRSFVSLMDLWSTYKISSKSDNPRTIFTMTAAAAQFYFRFRIGAVTVLERPKYVSKRLKSTSGLEKQTSVILEFYFWMRLRPIAVTGLSFHMWVPSFIQLFHSTGVPLDRTELETLGSASHSRTVLLIKSMN